MNRLLRFSRRDWLQLLGLWLLGTAGCFLLSFQLLQLLLAPALVEASSDRIQRMVVLTEALLKQESPQSLPDGLIVAPSPPAGSVPMGDGIDQQLLADLLSSHGIERRLRHAAPSLLDPLGAYWVELRSSPRLWVKVPSIFTNLPQFWPLVRTFALIGGALLALVVFLRQRVEQPLWRLLASLPQAVPDGESLPLVRESGVEPVQALARRVNQLIEQHNSRAASRRDLLRGLGHDLRGPLTRLLLRSEKLRRQAEPQAVLDALPAIEADLEQLRELAEQITALACAADPGRERRSFSLEGLCARVAESYPGGTVQVQVPRLLVRVNQELLQRSLTNLIDNALEYGAPPVLISAERRRVPGLQILVDDHGPGLADYGSASLGVLPRADDRQRQRHRGIGLAIVRRFCIDHGGELRLEPAPGGGLRACLQLPPEVLV